jgi:hypothetical protein
MVIYVKFFGEIIGKNKMMNEETLDLVSDKINRKYENVNIIDNVVTIRL